MNILLSVIVPVYKTRDFLDVCVQSLVQQTYKNLEIILVDDGSPDDSGAMCDAWAKKDTRIQVIHKENGGPSSARNAGISVATGQYVAFVDSDDYLLPTAYESLLYLLEKHQADTVVFSFNRLFGENQIPFDEQLPEGVWRGDDIRIKIIYPLFSIFAEDHHFIPTVWRMIYTRSVIVENGLHFEDDMHVSEDLLFNVDYFSFCKSVAVTMDRLYVYRDNTIDSFSSRYNPDFWIASQTQHDLLLKKCIKYQFPEKEYLYRVEAQFLSMASVAVKREVKATDVLGKQKVMQHVSKIATDAKLVDAMHDYSGPSLPFTVSLFCFLMKYNALHVLYSLIRIYIARGLEK